VGSAAVRQSVAENAADPQAIRAQTVVGRKILKNATAAVAVKH